MFHWGLMTTYLNHALAITHLPSTITSFRPFNGHWSAQVWFFRSTYFTLTSYLKKKKIEEEEEKKKKVVLPATSRSTVYYPNRTGAVNLIVCLPLLSLILFLANNTIVLLKKKNTKQTVMHASLAMRVNCIDAGSAACNFCKNRNVDGAGAPFDRCVVNRSQIAAHQVTMWFGKRSRRYFHPHLSLRAHIVDFCLFIIISSHDLLCWPEGQHLLYHRYFFFNWSYSGYVI